MANIVYQYCSVEAFDQIVSKARIRFSDVHYMNDFKELTYAYELILEMLKKPGKMIGSNVAKSNWYKLFCQYFEAYFEAKKMKNDYDRRYIACFSKEPDLLNQWIAYANNGRGVCIGFDLDRLVSEKAYGLYFSPEEIYSGDKNNVQNTNSEKEKYAVSLKYIFNDLEGNGGERNGKITYMKPATKKYNQYKSDLFQWFNEKCLEYSMNDLEGSDKDTILMCAKGFCMRIFDTIWIKSSDFAHEKEIRVECQEIMDPSKNHLMIPYLEMFEKIDYNVVVESPHYYVSGNRIRSGVYVDFNKIKNDVIKEIVLGPQNSMSEYDNELVNYLNYLGYNDVKISKSSIAFRN